MNRRKLRARKGNVLVMTAVLMTTLVALLAFAIDLGYVYAVRTELQRAADSAAIAATWELIDKDGDPGSETTGGLADNASLTASQYAKLNKVGNSAPALAGNDVTVGYMANPSDPSDPLISTPMGKLPNAVKVRVQRTSAQNGEISFFFGRALGFSQTSLDAEATAAFLNSFSGFRIPADGSNLHILPFALDLETWNALETYGTDSWSYNPENKTVCAGCDGVKECNLFPQGNGCPGIRGTVDIGSNNNSTADIARQIVDGINASDMEQMGGLTQFDADGELHLIADTGISAGVKDQLVSIIGKPRIIPIFSSVTGPGNNADYTIVKWVGVRVLDIKLTGSLSSKRVIVQPCNVVTKGAIYEPGGTQTQYVHSPVWLCR